MSEWKTEEAEAAAKKFLKESDGQRYRSIYKDGDADDYAIFSADAERRSDTASHQAKQWWRQMQNLPGQVEIDRLALAEPLAQTGCTVEQVFQKLPSEPLPDALLTAWRRINDPHAVEGISDTAGWSHDKIKKACQRIRNGLDWDNTTGSARTWWTAFEQQNQNLPGLVLRLMEELKRRHASITEFFLAYVYSNTDSIQANLHYLDYTRLKKQGERSKREAAESVGTEPTKIDIAQSWAVAPGVSKTADWSEKQILQKINELQGKLDWANASDSMRKWWESFDNENRHRPALVLRFLEELSRRNATITDIFWAYAYSNTNNIQANLHYLDYSRLKKEKEKEVERLRAGA